MNSRDADWSDRMRAARAGDEGAYRRLLEDLSTALRSATRRRLGRMGITGLDAEDVVQETLLAIHLKRHTWDETAPLAPWVAAIARHKLLDAVRRRGYRITVPIDDVIDVLPSADPEERLSERETDRHLDGLPSRQRDVVRAIAVDGLSIADAATRHRMSEGAVRVALHRGLKTLARMNRTVDADP